MIKSVNNYPVSQLFDIEAGVVYAIPRYQREYTWSKAQWESLFDDVQENDPGYFLGSIICINQTTDTLAVQRLEVVDGQQRLTTLSLLFAALYQSMKLHEKDLDDDQRVELINLKRKLVLKKVDDQLRVIPQIQNNNQNDYKAVLSDVGVISSFDTPAYAGNRKIFRAFRYFQARIEEMVNAGSDRLASIMAFLDKVSQACLVPPEMRDDTAFMDRIHAFLPGWDVPKINKDLVTNHFGLVSDFLSECWSQLRNQSRVSELQNRVFFGGALSGRDTNAINKTVSGLLKLLYPSSDTPVPDEDLEWGVRIALEVRRRVKEQQKRVGAAEFRNTHFSYIMGADGVEKFVSTPELQSDNSIGGDPLEPGQVWTISPGGGEENSGLYRIEVNEGPGSGVKVLNKPIPPAFRESIGFAEQNLYARSMQLVGDKDPRQHEFTVQLRAFDAAKSGAKLGVASLVALCTSLLKRSVRGGLIMVGEINLGGSIEPVHNAVTIAEIAVEKGATSLLMPVACRRQLVDLSDDMATRVDIQFYSDARDALLKAMAE